MVKGKRKLGKKPDLESLGASARIVQWFFSFPDSDWTLTEVCEQTGTAKKTAGPIIDDLLKKGFVIKNTFGRSWRLMANVRSVKFARVKSAANLANICSADIVDKVREAYPQAHSIILFGSFRKGEDGRASDLDIAVEIPERDKPLVVEAFEVVNVGYRGNVKVNLLLFSREKVDINLFSNLVNGIVLDGFLEARP